MLRNYGGRAEKIVIRRLKGLPQIKGKEFYHQEMKGMKKVLCSTEKIYSHRATEPQRKDCSTVMALQLYVSFLNI